VFFCIRVFSVADGASLFLEHRDGVFRYLCRMVGHAEDARDLTQEVFLRVARAQARPDEPAERRAWVFHIARNLALNHARDGRRRPVEVGLDVDAGGRPTQETAAAVQQALASLTDLDRDVFLLRESAGLSYEEIARACEISPDAVRSRLHRARQELRIALSAPVTDQLARGIRWKDPNR
jgi:RNA polymerase sigma-70 factor (ECF subfamily)